MATPTKDMTGKRFGRLSVVSYSGKNNRRLALWSCLCDCGTTTLVTGARLRNGATSSCGCFRRDRGKQNATHGMHGTHAYRIWIGMLSRCRNKNATGYKNYGGRGISVCNEWLEFENFYKDMGPPPEGLTLDRKDTNGDYSKGNCRWATWFEQADNKRSVKMLSAFGKTQSLATWSREFGIHYSTLRDRLTYEQLDLETALTRKVTK